MKPEFLKQQTNPPKQNHSSSYQHFKVNFARMKMKYFFLIFILTKNINLWGQYWLLQTQNDYSLYDKAFKTDTISNTIYLWPVYCGGEPNFLITPFKSETNKYYFYYNNFPSYNSFSFNGNPTTFIFSKCAIVNGGSAKVSGATLFLRKDNGISISIPNDKEVTLNEEIGLWGISFANNNDYNERVTIDLYADESLIGRTYIDSSGYYGSNKFKINQLINTKDENIINTLNSNNKLKLFIYYRVYGGKYYTNTYGIYPYSDTLTRRIRLNNTFNNVNYLFQCGILSFNDIINDLGEEVDKNSIFVSLKKHGEVFAIDSGHANNHFNLNDKNLHIIENDIIDVTLSKSNYSNFIFSITIPKYFSHNQDTYNSCPYPQHTGSATFTLQNGQAPYKYFYSTTKNFNNTGNYSESIYIPPGINRFTYSLGGKNNPYSTNITYTDPNNQRLSISNNSYVNIDNPMEGTWNFSFSYDINLTHRTYFLNKENINNSTFTISDLYPENYSVTITDNRGCQIVKTFNIASLPKPTLKIESINSPPCSNEKGSITLIGSGGVTPYTYYITDSINNEASNSTGNFSNLAVGINKLHSIDSNGCESNTIIDTVSYDPPRIESLTHQNPHCAGENSGSISLITHNAHSIECRKGEGSVETYTITGNTLTIPERGAGNYTLIAKNGRCNSDSAIATLIDPPLPIININAISHPVSCYNDSDGEIILPNSLNDYSKIYLSHGTIIDSIIPSSNNKFQNLNARTYSLFARKTDSNCLTNSINVTVDNKNPITATLIASPLNCPYDFATGSILIKNISGGNGDYFYKPDSSENWISIANDSIFLPNLNDGNYNFTIRDRLFCESTFSTTVLRPNPLMFFADTTCYNGYPIPCHNDTMNAQITFNPSGGTPPFRIDTIISNNNKHEFNKLNLNKSYNFILTDSKNCKKDTTICLTRRPEPLSMNYTTSNYNGCAIRCNNGNDGEIIINPLGGVAPYIITVMKGDSIINSSSVNSSLQLNSLSAGNYSVSITDANNCYYIDSIQLLQPTQLGGNILYKNSFEGNIYQSSFPYHGYAIRCKGENTTVQVNAFGGISPYYYNWKSSTDSSINNNNFISSNIFVESAGKYCVIIKDTNNCLDTISYTLTEPDSLNIQSLITETVSCYYKSDGRITVSAMGGIPDSANCTFYLYNQQMPIDTVTNYPTSLFNNLPGSIYKVKVIDANQCIVERDSIDIQNRDTLRISVVRSVQPSCHAGNDGMLTLSASKPNYHNNYHYSVWRSDSLLLNTLNTLDTLDILNVSNLYSGTYHFRVTDAIGCQDSNSFELSQPSKMTIQIDSMIANKCYNDHTALLKLKASGGVGGYQFAYKYNTFESNFKNDKSDTSSILRLSGLNWNYENKDTPISYIIRLRDKNYKESQPACIITDTFLLLPQVKRIQYDVYTQQPGCNNTTDGKLSVNNLSGGTGGMGSWTINWNDKNNNNNIISTTKNLENIGAGTYSLLIRDSVGCENQTEIDLVNPPQFLANSQFTVINCSNTNSVTYYIEGANGFPYSYSHNNLSWIAEEATSEIAIPIDTGKHTFIFKNSKGCTFMDTLEFYYPAPVIDSISILDASIGGAKNGKAFLYTSCGNGGNIYQWTLPDNSVIETNQNSLNGLSAATYHVKVIDRKGMESSQIVFTVNETNRITIGIDSIKHPTCSVAQNGYVRVAVNAPSPIVSIIWKINGTEVGRGNFLNNISIGDYLIVVTDSLGNKDSLAFSLISNNINLSSLNGQRVTCNGYKDQTIEILAWGGSNNYKFHWNTGATDHILQNAGAGTYHVKVTDVEDSLCYADTTIIIQEPQPIQVNLVGVIKPTCKEGNDGIITVSATGGNGQYTYYWPDISQNQATATTLLPGDYRIEVTDIKGCKTDTIFSLPDTLPIRINTVWVEKPLCYGNSNGKITVLLKGGRSPYMINWPDIGKGITGSSQENLKAGLYHIYGRDANNCSFNDSIVIREPSPLIIDSIIYNLPGCSYSQNANILIKASGGTLPYSYIVDNKLSNNATIYNLSGGTHSVKIIDKNLCFTTSNINIPNPEPLNFSNINIPPTCYGFTNGSISIEPTGGTPPYRIYLFNQLQNNPITNLSDNEYNIQIQDKNNCSFSRTVKLIQPPRLTASILLLKANPCYGDCKAQLVAQGTGGTLPYTFQWKDGIYDSIHNNSCKGAYEVQVKDKNNCTYQIVTNVAHPSPIKRDSAILIEPTCFGGTDGKIYAYYSGGTGNLQKIWPNNKTMENLQNVSAGLYRVKVVDNNNCYILDSLQLIDPPKETISRIVPYYKLCINQVLPLSPGIWQKYWWYKNNNYLNSDDTLRINSAGNYAVKVKSFKGCMDSMNFTIEYSKQIINSNFLLSHDAVAGEEVQVIDVSWPIPETITWSYSTDSISLIQNSDDRQSLVFEYPGEYPVTLTTFYNSCVDSVSKIVVVYNSEDDYKKGKYPLTDTLSIIDLELYPNPNDGNFNLYIKLVDVQNITIDIFAISTGSSVYHQELKGLDNYLQPIQISNQSKGVYGLRVITNKEVKNIIFIKL
jgi:hypothetical protein